MPTRAGVEALQISQDADLVGCDGPRGLEAFDGTGEQPQVFLIDSRPTQLDRGHLVIKSERSLSLQGPQCGRVAAELLAQGEMFVNQVFRYGAAAYGVQFHPEVTAEIVDRWTRFATHRLNMPGAQARDEQIWRQGLHQPAITNWLERFLPTWLSRPAAPARSLPASARDGPGE